MKDKKAADMDKTESAKIRTGIIITLIAGILWGFSGTCSQFLFQDYGITPLFLTTIRQTFTGIILTVIALLRHRDRLTAMLKNRRSLAQLVIAGIGGLLFNQLSYMETISYTNSGTATVLQYIGPVLIMVVSCMMARRLPRRREILSIILVVVGTFLIATHGNPGSLYITKPGLIWGLLSAVALVTYTMLPVPLIREYGAIPTVGCGMLIGGIVMAVTNRFHGGAATPDARYVLFLFIIVVFGTVLPYTMYLTGVTLCGAVRGSMIACIEPVSATVWMVVWLHEPFYAIDFVGFCCILATVFLLVRSGQSTKDAASKAGASPSSL
ncbi:MAG: DMT family transporter [Clostridia bacterium]|nr:DMT family transporter [Clostridia bacterium]